HADLRAAWSAPLAADGTGVDWTSQLPPDMAACSRIAIVLPPVPDGADVEGRTGVPQGDSLLAAMRAVTAVGSARLWVITSNGSGFMPEGLARVFALEHPGHWGGLIDLPAPATARDLEAAATILGATD